MKKIFLAAAVVSAAGASIAQSSVTLFGVADTGIGHGSGSLTSRTQLYNQGGNTTSRLGMRGVEDLGGGYAASFWLEAGINIDDGTGGNSNTNNQASGATSGNAFMFNRRSTLSLSGALGEVRLGRDFTAHYYNRSQIDPFGNVGVGTIQPQVGTIGGVTSTRASNAVSYFLPSGLGGVYGQIQYFFGENASGTPTSRDGRGYSSQLGYERGPMKIALAYGRTEYARTATLGDIQVANIGATYDFGLLKVFGGYYHDRVERNVELTAKGYSLGTSIPVGAHQFKAAYSAYETDAAGNPHAGKLSLGYVYALSKRTAVYATWARVANRGGAAFALNGSTTAPNLASRGYDLGLRHNF